MGQTTDIGERGTTMGNPPIKKVNALPGCNAVVRRDQEVAVVWYHRSQHSQGAMPGCNGVVRIDQEVTAVWCHRLQHSQGAMPERVKVGDRARVQCHRQRNEDPK